MSEPASTPKKKAAKKTAASKKPADHPKYIEMIVAAINALKERKGSSRQAIQKYITATYKVSDGAGQHIKMALKRGVESKELTQTKGTGASGSFKVTATVKKVKKVAAPKKPAAKKPVKKVAAKKPAVKKSAKKAATPKSKKTATKKAAKKPTAKKPVAKKAAKKTPKKTTGKKGKK